jgi:hypothetical protein
MPTTGADSLQGYLEDRTGQSVNPLTAGTPGLGAAAAQTGQDVGAYIEAQRQRSADLGLWDPQAGLPTSKGLISAAGQTAQGVMFGTSAPGEAAPLTPAIRFGGKLYRAPADDFTHMGALDAVPPTQRSDATLDADNRVFVTNTGRVLNRWRAADYAQKNDLIDPGAPDYAHTSPELIGEWLRPPGASEPPPTPAYGSGQLIRMSEPITAYHGSPHEFAPTETNPLGEFDLAKIGSGEGAQAYGHGTYLAGNERVAQSYRDQLSAAPWNTPQVRQHAAEALQAATDAGLSGDAAKRYALNDLQERADSEGGYHTKQALYDTINNFDDIISGKSSGHMYQSELHIHPDHMLDWDNPISEQSNYVRDRLRKAGVEVAEPPSLSSIGDPKVRSIVGRAMRQDDDPNNIGLMVDNDQALYADARSHAKSRGINLDDLDRSPGEHIEMNAEAFIDAANAARRQTGQYIHGRLPTTTYSMRADASSPWVASGAASYDEALAKVGGDRKRVLEVNNYDPAGAAQRLLDAGIPGIRYLDQGSRAQGDGSHNYVVFDPKTINIVKRYGIPAMIAGGADALADHKQGNGQ